MKPLGNPSGASEARAEAALGRCGALVGDTPHYAPLGSSVMMPMHMAGDAIPYAVARSHRDAPTLFLKVYETDMPAGLDLAATAAASRQAAALGLAPALLAEDPEQDALLFTLLPSPWRPAMRPDLDRLPLKAAALAAKRAWHDGAPLQRTRTPFDRITDFLETIDAMADRPGGLSLPQGFATLRAWTGRIEQAFHAVGHDSGPTHGENTLSNIMVGPGDAVQLIDFDRAANADPHSDLGAFCVEVCSFEDEVAETVALYLGAPDPCVTARVQLYMIVDDMLWGCWSLIAHQTSARCGPVEFYKYAQNRFVRARYWLARWDVDALLRRI